MREAPDEGSASRSIGAPNRGRLDHGVAIRSTTHMVVAPSGHPYGTAELVALIGRAAERLQRETPGPRLLVGALSQSGGGRIPPHSSHQSGRDADLGLFHTDEDDRPVEAPHFLDLDASGCARDRGVAYCFDGARTFRFIVLLLDDEHARVQWILVAADLAQRILSAGRRMGADDETLQRVELAIAPRDGSESHRSHLHVRIYCPRDDRGQCQDAPPYQSWYDGEPPQPERRVRARSHRRRAARLRRIRARRARR